MPYSDKEKQKEADRDRQRRYRASKKGVTKEGVTVSGSGTSVTPRRGKDITKFEHLPLDVQASILRISDGDEIVKANRTVIAISYQHQFPGRFYH